MHEPAFCNCNCTKYCKFFTIKNFIVAKKTACDTQFDIMIYLFEGYKYGGKLNSPFFWWKGGLQNKNHPFRYLVKNFNRNHVKFQKWIYNKCFVVLISPSWYVALCIKQGLHFIIVFYSILEKGEIFQPTLLIMIMIRFLDFYRM